MCVISEAALLVQNAMVGILSSRAMSSAKLISIVVRTHEAVGTRELRRPRTAAHGDVVTTASSR